MRSRSRRECGARTSACRTSRRWMSYVTTLNLSQMNFGVDNGMYPLGSCTMKYNPKYADKLASLPTVTSVHPCQDEDSLQGALRLMRELEKALCAISYMDAVTLQPAAGAHGEFTGMLIARLITRTARTPAAR